MPDNSNISDYNALFHQVSRMIEAAPEPVSAPALPNISLDPVSAGELYRILDAQSLHSQPITYEPVSFTNEGVWGDDPILTSTYTTNNATIAFQTNEPVAYVHGGSRAVRSHGLEAGIPDTHPLVFLSDLTKEMKINSLTFAQYRINSGKSEDTGTYENAEEIRTSFSTPTPRDTHDLDAQFLAFINNEDIIGNLEDVAIQSKVLIGGNYFHIPMIDFYGKDLDLIKQALNYSSDTIGMDRDDFVLYNSGNSFHAYGRLLVPDEEWMDFSSQLLLVRHPKDKRRIVDSRWIAHSQLKRGFSLRLTKVGKKQLPTLVK